MNPTLARAVEEAVRWYGKEAASLRGNLHNTAFLMISDMALAGLREQFTRRLTVVGNLFPEVTKAQLGKLVTDTIARLGVDDSPPAFPPNSEITIAEYLRFTKSLFEAASRPDVAVRNMDDFDDIEKRKGQQFARNMWAIARDARIFMFDPKVWATSYHAADVYTSETILKEEWKPYTEESPEAIAERSKILSSKDEALRRVEVISEAATRVPFPDPLPFERMYIGLGPGQALSPMQVAFRVADPRARTRVVSAAMLGYLVWQTNAGSYAVEVIQIVEAEDNYFLPNVVCHADQWIDGWQSLAPWILTHLIGAINEHRSLIVEQKPKLRDRLDFEKTGKKMKIGGWLPRPYYIVELRKELIDQSQRNAEKKLGQIARELRYRFDRRGHERCYIRRGKLPLDEKNRQKLIDAGYRIWTTDEPDSTAYRQLLERQQRPKAADEWLAILTKWIDPTIVGPDHLPYIPAMRVATTETP